jgi:selenocysteine lyase/cysteine desulfurase
MNEMIRAMFPGAENHTYLNSAAVSLLPAATVDAVISQLRDVSANGTLNYADWISTKNRARGLVAGLLGVRPDQIAFMRNTADGFSSVAGGIDWKAGDNIVTFAKEFPSNFYPWRRVRDDFGVELRVCSEREGRIDLNEFIGLIDGHTKIAAISAVQFASGFRADIERIGRAARAQDALFAVDFIQALGTTPFDLPAQLVDIGAGGSHKWLCSPEGCGILYLSDRARDRLRPTFVGWVSVETPWDFDDYEQPFKPNALAWESGTGGAALFYGLEQSLKILTEAGPARIEGYLAQLTDELCDGLEGRGYELVSSRRPGEKSQIVCVRHRGAMTSTEIAKHLEARNVVVSPRGERLRIAPHLFNNARDIEVLLENLPR